MGLIQRLRAIASDGNVTNDEWESVAQDVAALPRRAGAEARELLDVWAQTRTIESYACGRIEESLERLGYAIPGPSCSARGNAASVARTNVTTNDAELDRLSTLVASTRTVAVGVVDAGFELSHGALATHTITAPRDFIDGDADPTGGDHGTHVAAIALRGSTRLTLVPARAADDHDASASTGAKLARAIDHVVANGARVVNLSLSTGDVEPVLAAIDRHPDVVFVLASGAGGRDLATVRDYLAANARANVLVVNMAKDDGTPGSANYGGPTLIGAVGDSVFSAVSGDRYAWLSGSSMAAPQVTACVAKCLLLDPTLTVANLRSILRDTADVTPAWRGLNAANGTLNSDRALRLVALRGLRRQGLTLDAALDRLALPATERSLLRRLA